MANINKKSITGEDLKGLVIHEINQVNIDRTPKDVATLRSGLLAAENIYFPNRSRLLDLYADVWLDGHFTGVWGKRRAASTKKKIIFADKSGKEKDEFKDLLESKQFRKLKQHIIDYIIWGLNGAQFIPGDKFKWVPIPRKHILIEKCQIKINQSDQSGVDYTKDPFVMVYGDKGDLGLMLKVSFYALIKKGNFADWAQYSEIFGQPIRVIKYDAYDDKTRIQLKQVLDESGSSLALMIPKQTEFEIMDGKTSNGNGDLQDKLKTACNNEISLIVLGNTETSTNENGGSNAKAEIQDEGEDDLKEDDLKDLLSYLNDDKFLKILASYGYPVEGGKFVVQEKNEPYKTKHIVETITAVRNSGTPVDDDYVYEATGIPKPENYKELKAQKEKEAEKQYTERSVQSHSAKPQPPKDLTGTIWNRLRHKLADFFDQAP